LGNKLKGTVSSQGKHR